MFNRKSPQKVLPAEEIYFTINEKTHVANFSEASNYNGTIVLNEVKIEHAGEWTCHVRTKEYGNVSGTINVNIRPVVLTNTRVRIYEIPNQKFQFEGSGRTIIRGEDVNLTCPVFANPKPQIIWYKGAQEITKDERIKIDNEGNLIIQNVTYLDEGIYTCKAINTIIDKSTNINKKVQSNVSIERHLKVKSLFFILAPNRPLHF